MPWMIQMGYFAAAVLGLVFFVYVGFWLLLALLCIGVLMVAWRHLRVFLVAKGILNPAYGRAPEAHTYEEATIIDGEFARVETTSEELHDTAKNMMDTPHHPRIDN